MRFLGALSSAILLSVSSLSTISPAAAAKDSFSTQTDVFYWPSAATKPSKLAEIAYDPASLKTIVLSYTPPIDAFDSDELVRVGVFVPPVSTTATSSSSSSSSSQSPQSSLTDDKQKLWSGSLLSREATVSSGTSVTNSKSDTSSPKNDTIVLHLSPSGDVYHVSAFMVSTDGNNASPNQLNVQVLRPSVGPQPHLNQQKAGGSSGQIVGEEGEPVEKTFFQRYWWVFAIGAFLALSGGGGESGGQS